MLAVTLDFDKLQNVVISVLSETWSGAFNYNTIAPSLCKQNVAFQIPELVSWNSIVVVSSAVDVNVLYYVTVLS